jgi:hypothetical protein
LSGLAGLLNSAGEAIHAATVQAEARQTNLPVSTMERAQKATPAAPGRLKFTIASEGGNVRLKYFGAKEGGNALGPLDVLPAGVHHVRPRAQPQAHAEAERAGLHAARNQMGRQDQPNAFGPVHPG